MVLGRIKKFADLNLQESEAFLKVCPCAIVDEAKVFDCLLLSGVVYTNEVYNQSKTNDYTLAINDGNIGKAIKYIINTEQDYIYIVLVHHCVVTSGPCNHIKLISESR